MNRFVKDNLVLFIVMGSTIIGAIVLLTFAVLAHAQMFNYYEEANSLKSAIESLNAKKPAPVQGNIAPMTATIEFVKGKTAEVLPYFGQIKGAALDAFVKELGVDKQKFLETFRAAWESDEDRKAPGGRHRFYERFSQGLNAEHNWATDLKLSPTECLERWQKALAAFRTEYQKLTVEEITEGNQNDILLAALGSPRNFDGRPELCMQEFIVPMAQQMQELCAKPPLTPEEIALAASKKKKSDDDAEEDAMLNRIELLGDAGSFGFDLKTNPKPEEIVDIVKNGEVIGDLVRRIATAKVSSINSFIIRNKYAGEKIGRYVVYHYTFSVTGDIARIRGLVQSLNAAVKEKRMYIVRSVFLYADRDGAGEIMQARREEALRQREELDGSAASDNNNNPAGQAGSRGRVAMSMPMDPGMPGMDDSSQKVQEKTPEQIRAEEMAKPYDKRSGYGQLLFGGSSNCEAVFDVEYVYLAEPELE